MRKSVRLVDRLLLALVASRLSWLDWFGAARQVFLPSVSAAPLVKPVIFLAMGLYGRYWSYGTVSDLLVIRFGVTTASLAG